MRAICGCPMVPKMSDEVDSWHIPTPRGRPSLSKDPSVRITAFATSGRGESNKMGRVEKTVCPTKSHEVSQKHAH